MSRYINASDVPRLLGKEYQFFWTTDSDINRIIFGKFVKPELTIAINELPDKILNELIPDGDITKKRKKLTEHIIETKNKITSSETHVEYINNEKDFIKHLPSSLQKIVEKDFTMERGNFEEARVIKEFNIPKTNKLMYYSFTQDNIKYKIGCRFDGPQIEIKTRKNKLLGVPEYELVQMHLYMATENTEQWTLKEKFNDQVVDHEIFFNKLFFEKIKTDIHNRWEYFLNLNKNT